MVGHGRNKDIPVIISHCAWTRGQFLGDGIVSPIPADRVFPQTQEGLFIAQHATIISFSGLSRMSQPLYIVPICACTYTQIMSKG